MSRAEAPAEVPNDFNLNVPHGTPTRKQRPQLRATLAAKEIAEGVKRLSRLKCPVFVNAAGDECRAGAGRWEKIENGMQRRSVAFTISKRQSPIGAGRFVVWRGAAASSLEDFWEAADGLSEADEKLAGVLGQNWDEWDQPLHYGDIVEFRRLILSPAAKRVDWPSLVSQVMAHFFSERCSLLMVHAFPLEYESRLPAHDCRAVEEFQFRLKAMIRHYWRTLAVEPLPREMQSGWLWRALGDCPPPLANSEVTAATDD